MTAPVEQPRRSGERHHLVDWRRLGRRLGLSATILLSFAAVAWLVVGLVTDGVDPGELPGYLGLALGGMFVAELIFVGGSAVQGLLRAGEEGERLAGGDVGLLPPQVRRKLFGRRGRDDDRATP
ncbi:MAG: hypothetical protein R3343_02000 [Nitriliruptorales bacterium]|nr:hypothetical protein [Nitriliruptorales bacterium]